MDSALQHIVALIPAFKRSVVPPLDEGTAECVAIYWTIVTANDSIDNASASEVLRRIIPLMIDQRWSFWNGREAAFQARFMAMCQATAFNKHAALLMGADQGSREHQQTLSVMIVAKTALASSGKDDTNEASVVSLMEWIGEFHEKLWPILRTAGQPRPMSAAVEPQQARKHHSSSLQPAKEGQGSSGERSPHPYYVAHFTEVQSVVLAWRGHTDQDPKKMILAAEVMQKTITHKAMMLANGIDPAEADEQRRLAEEDFDRENPGVRVAAYALMRSQLAQWQASQQVAKSGCVIPLFAGLFGIAAFVTALVKFIEPI